MNIPNDHRYPHKQAKRLTLNEKATKRVRIYTYDDGERIHCTEDKDRLWPVVVGYRGWLEPPVERPEILAFADILIRSLVRAPRQILAKMQPRIIPCTNVPWPSERDRAELDYFVYPHWHAILFSSLTADSSKDHLYLLRQWVEKIRATNTPSVIITPAPIPVQVILPLRPKFT